MEVLSNALEMKRQRGMLRTSTLGYYYSTWNPNAESVVPWEKPSPETIQRATEIKEWWKSRDNEPGIDRTDKNIANMSHQDTLGMNNFYILNRMIAEYDKAHISPEEKARQEQEKLEQQRLIEQREEQRKLRMEQEEQQRRLRMEREEQERGIIDDKPRVPVGSAFKAKFKFLASVRKDGRYGTYYLVTFEDRSGNKYATFSKATFNATPNSIVSIQAVLGETNAKFRSTKLTKVKLLKEGPVAPVIEEVAEDTTQEAEANNDISQIVAGEEFKMRIKFTGSEMKNTRRGQPVTPYYLNKFEDTLGHKLYNFATEEFNAGVGDEIFVSGTKVRYNRAYGNQVKNLQLTQEPATGVTETPTIPDTKSKITEPEPAAPEPAAPEPTTPEAPKTLTETAKTFGEELKKRVTTRDMSQRITIEEAIPIYLQSLKNIKPSFNSDAWAISLKKMYEDNGQEYLFKMIDRMPGMFV